MGRALPESFNGGTYKRQIVRYNWVTKLLSIPTALTYVCNHLFSLFIVVISPARAQHTYFSMGEREKTSQVPCARARVSRAFRQPIYLLSTSESRDEIESQRAILYNVMYCKRGIICIGGSSVVGAHGNSLARDNVTPSGAEGGGRSVPSGSNNAFADRKSGM